MYKTMVKRISLQYAMKALSDSSDRRDSIMRCDNAINGKIELFLFQNFLHTYALRVHCEQINEIYNALHFSVNRKVASRYRIASV